MFFHEYIIREAYMILAIIAPVQYQFINNYVDWDQFNTQYNKNYKVKKMCTTDKIAAQFK